MFLPTLLALLLTAAADPVTWTRSVVPGQPVSVELPGKIEVRHAERTVVIGTVVSETLVVERGGSWMAATVTLIPPFASQMASESTIFNTTRRSVLSENHGTATTWSDVKRSGLTGKRLAFTSSAKPQHRGTSEIYTWGNNVATFTALAGPEIPEAEVTRFFASIRIDTTAQ